MCLIFIHGESPLATQISQELEGWWEKTNDILKERLSVEDFALWEQGIVAELAEIRAGIQELAVMRAGIDAGIGRLDAGIDRLEAGSREVQAGSREIKAGIRRLDSGLADLGVGLAKMDQDLENLDEKIDTTTNDMARLQVQAQEIERWAHQKLAALDSQKLEPQEKDPEDREDEMAKSSPRQ